MNAIYDTALLAYKSGISIVPPKQNGSKAPLGSWKKYQSEIAERMIIEGWYQGSLFSGLGVVCGQVSGNLEWIDFDSKEIYQLYKDLAQTSGLGNIVKRIENGYLEYTPNGVHWPYYCEKISGNKKLAKNKDKKSIIETRGEGGFIIIAPTNGAVNPGGNYELIQGGLDTIATIATDERKALHELARAFNHEIKTDELYIKSRANKSKNRPGDDFCKSTSWNDLLPKHGWVKVCTKNNVTHWRRPDKKIGISATTNYADSDLLYVFSTSTEFEAERGYNKFSVYSILKHDGDHSEAASVLASLGFGDGLEASEIDAEIPVPVKPAKNKIPSELLKIPGRLQAFVDWTNESAPKPQPVFAIQAALALGSLVAGRKYVSSNQNYTSMWFLNVGQSGCGKEHAKTVLEKILEVAGYDDLINEGGYTSAGAVFTRLQSHPCHITIIDEIGKMLQAANDRGSYHEKIVAIKLMESWGRCHGTMRPMQYSGMSLKQTDKDRLQIKIQKPAITILGMTTPDTLYNALTHDDINDGYLGRFLIVETPVGRQLGWRIQDLSEPPESIVKWIKHLRTSGTGNLANIDLAGSEPCLTTINISTKAGSMFDAFQAKMEKIRIEADKEGLGDLFSKINEIAIRVSMIVALSINSKNPVIGEKSAKWACDYVGYHAEHAFRKMADNIETSPRSKLIKKVMLFIESKGEKGAANWELMKGTAPRGPLRDTPERDRKEILNTLKTGREIYKLVTKSKNNKTREAWVSTQFKS